MSGATHTTIATWVMPILSALQPYSDGSKLLAQVNIDSRCIEDANQRIPIDKMTRLWRLAEELSGDDCIGLEVIKHVTPTNFHALVYAHHASSSMRESLERIKKFSDVVSTAVRIEITETEENVILSWHMVDDISQPSHHAIDSFMALIAIGGQQLSKEKSNPITAVQLTRTAPKDTSRHEKHYNCPISYDAERCEMHFSQQLIDLPIPTGNSELVRINEQVLTEYLARFRKNDIVRAVYNSLIDLMPRGEPTQEKVASQLGTSCRSLHRKLKELDTSYKVIVDETRQHLAMQYLKQSDLSITAITYQLGFLDSSSFARSFRRWTGLSPSEFRNHQ
ncbi:MAG TPA: AraC family transcriptional regulator [Porticoccus sp.]|nr:AraC family transcriptional regulator [Porticoccus sp.]